MFCVKIVGLLTFLVCVSAYPYPYDVYRPVPRKTVMFGSYYGHPLTRRSYIPQNTMTMFATGGDAVATNSFVGEQIPLSPQEEQTIFSEQPQSFPQEQIPLDQAEPSEVTQQPIPVPVEESSISNAEEEEESTIKPHKTQKRKQKPRVIVQDEEEDEDEQSGWPFQLGKGVPSYNAFFPITFAAGRQVGRQSVNEGETIPGSATAIANAFSTGKGGVASSHATAFGDPALASYFLKKNLRKKPKSLEPTEE